MNNFIINQTEISDNNRNGYFNQIVGVKATPSDRIPYFVFPLSLGDGAISAFYVEKLNYFGEVVSSDSISTTKINVTAAYYELTSHAYTFDVSCLYRLRIVTGSKTLISQNFITFALNQSYSLTFDSIITTFDLDVLTFDQE